MREILFRGKRTDNGEWVEGYLTRAQGMYTIQYEDQEGFYCEDRVITETVGQFIGLTDKNGKKIFEGDIVQKILGFKYITNNRYAVQWEDYSCGFEPFSDSKENCGHCGGGEDPARMEVIGNIHDNPELLEVKDA